MSRFTVRLKSKRERRILGGHQWVFSNEIADVDGEPKPGEFGRLFSARGEFLGSGCYNPKSLIAFRVFSREDREIGKEFLAETVARADDFRKSRFPKATSYRAVFGESDGLPGLVVDRFGDYLSVQSLCAGTESLKDILTEVLKERFKPKGIVAKNGASARKLEGLPPEDAIWHGDIPASVRIEENGAQFDCDLLGGQKTGWYFDQRENRQLAAAHAKGRVVLDLHTYLGSFAIHCAKAGAERVLGVDSSPGAIEVAKANAKLNAVDSICHFEKAPVEPYLGSLRELPKDRAPSMILLDPPPLAKNKKAVGAALRSLVQLNTKAMRGLRRGGLLGTSTCSHHVRPEMFRDALIESASRAQRRLREIEWRGASADHPVLLNMPETRYLNFGLFEIL